MTRSTPAHPAIEFRNVSKRFDGLVALNNLSFVLERNQMIVITGASGSGKTVLLHTAIGLLRPDEGQVLVEGHDLATFKEEELLKLRSELMGLVFQSEALFTAMTVYENTAYRLVEHGWRDEDIDRAVEEILRFVGLHEDMDKLPEELSIGMRRRLELARALVGWPAIMLFDEPTSGLDPINARQVLDLIIRARDVHNMSSLLVTKELHQIAYLVNHRVMQRDQDQLSVEPFEGELDPPIRVMMLEEGEIVFYGSHSKFKDSAEPTVVHLTHPETGMRITEFHIPDPWSKKGKRHDPLL